MTVQAALKLWLYLHSKSVITSTVNQYFKAMRLESSPCAAGYGICSPVFAIIIIILHCPLFREGCGAAARDLAATLHYLPLPPSLRLGVFPSNIPSQISNAIGPSIVLGRPTIVFFICFGK